MWRYHLIESSLESSPMAANPAKAAGNQVSAAGQAGSLPRGARLLKELGVGFAPAGTPASPRAPSPLGGCTEIWVRGRASERGVRGAVL